jgi:hypothetical protein
MIKGVGEDIYPSLSTNNLAASVLQDTTVTGSADMNNNSDSNGIQLISNQVARLTVKRNLQENYLLEIMMNERHSRLQQTIDSLSDHIAIKPATYLALKPFLKSPSAGFKTATQLIHVSKRIHRNFLILGFGMMHERLLFRSSTM